MPDVVIVGGGVVGLSAATYLARAGASVTLYERGDLYSEASGKNLGLLIDLDVPAGPGRELLRRGREMFFGLPDDLSADIGLRRNGAVTFGRVDRGDGDLFKSVFDANAAEVKVELLDRGQLHELVPALNDVYDVGLFSADEAKMDNGLVCQAFAREAERHGARLIRGVRIDALETDAGGAVTGVRTGGGKTVPADIVVLAAGSGSIPLAAPLGIAVPLVTIHAQVLLTAPIGPLVDPVLYDRGHVAAAGGTHEPDLLAAAQGVDGRFLFGGPGVSGVEREQVTLGGVATIAAALTDAIPALADVAIERIWGGMAGIPADGLPLVGGVPGREGLLFAVGAFNTAGPAVGQMVADLVRGDEVPLAAELSPTRVTEGGGLDLAGVSLP